MTDCWMSLKLDGHLDTNRRNAKICCCHIELVLCSCLKYLYAMRMVMNAPFFSML